MTHRDGKNEDISCDSDKGNDDDERARRTLANCKALLASLGDSQKRVDEAIAKANSCIGASAEFDTKWKAFQDKVQHVLTESLEGVRNEMLMSKTPDDTTEKFDSQEQVRAAAGTVASMLRESAKTVLFTGAGLSTSAGIPDYRGPAGVWTRRAKGERAALPDLNKTEPTVGHRVCRALVDKGVVSHIASQNIDGLHRRSGIPREKLTELHGNTNLETCVKCEKEYFRDFSCRAKANGPRDHRTGRMCEEAGCGAPLLDSIVNFGEDLPREAWQRAVKEFEEAEVAIVLGSSCRVRPASLLPERVARAAKNNPRAKLVIVNLQATPLDQFASLRVHAPTDAFLSLLAAELGVQPEE